MGGMDRLHHLNHGSIALGHTEALDLFLATLGEEEATDQTLTKLAKTSVNLKAAA